MASSRHSIKSLNLKPKHKPKPETGWSSSDDRLKLRGSCALEYSLKYTSSGMYILVNNNIS